MSHPSRPVSAVEAWQHPFGDWKQAFRPRVARRSTDTGQLGRARQSNLLPAPEGRDWNDVLRGKGVLA